MISEERFGEVCDRVMRTVMAAGVKEFEEDLALLMIELKRGRKAELQLDEAKKLLFDIRYRGLPVECDRRITEFLHPDSNKSNEPRSEDRSAHGIGGATARHIDTSNGKTITVCDNCGVEKGKHEEYAGEPAIVRDVGPHDPPEPDRCGEWVEKNVSPNVPPMKDPSSGDTVTDNWKPKAYDGTQCSACGQKGEHECY